MGIFYKNSEYVTENISVVFWHVKDIGLEMYIYFFFFF